MELNVAPASKDIFDINRSGISTGVAFFWAFHLKVLIIIARVDETVWFCLPVGDLFSYCQVETTWWWNRFLRIGRDIPCRTWTAQTLKTLQHKEYKVRKTRKFPSKLWAKAIHIWDSSPRSEARRWRKTGSFTRGQLDCAKPRQISEGDMKASRENPNNKQTSNTPFPFFKIDITELLTFVTGSHGKIMLKEDLK